MSAPSVKRSYPTGKHGVLTRHYLAMEVVMSSVYQMVSILKENYTLGELEERLELSTEDLEEGLDVLCEDQYDKVSEMLREDLWFF